MPHFRNFHGTTFDFATAAENDTFDFTVTKSDANTDDTDVLVVSPDDGNSVGIADIEFFFGDPGDVPIIGDSDVSADPTFDYDFIT